MWTAVRGPIDLRTGVSLVYLSSTGSLRLSLPLCTCCHDVDEEVGRR